MIMILIGPKSTKQPVGFTPLNAEEISEDEEIQRGTSGGAVGRFKFVFEVFLKYNLQIINNLDNVSVNFHE